jgi:hypothetical protein
MGKSVILHVNPKVGAIVDGFECSLETNHRRCYEMSLNGHLNRMWGSPSSALEETRVDPSLSMMFSKRNAYRVK